MEQLLIDLQALRAGELHIPAQQQVKAVKALGNDGAQLRRHGLEVALEIAPVVIENLLDVISLVREAQQVVGGHTEILRKETEHVKGWLLVLDFIAGDGGAGFVYDLGQLLLR